MSRFRKPASKAAKTLVSLATQDTDIKTPPLPRRHLAEAISLSLVLAVGSGLQTASAAPFSCPNAGVIDITGIDSPDTDPCDNSGTINVQSGGTLDNVGSLNNQSGGQINTLSGGSLNNSGTLTNESGGSLSNSGSLTNESGGALTNNYGLYNYGSLTNQSGATLTNNDLMDNYGSLNNAGGLTNNYDLYNFGNMTNQSGGTLTNNYDLYNYGDLTNESGGTLTNQGGLYNYTGADLNNAGGLTNNNFLGNYGNLTNQSGGTLTNEDHMDNIGSLTNQSGATLTNNYDLHNFGSLTNESGGTLTNNDYMGNYGSGSLSNSGGLTNNYHMDNFGSLTNESGGSLTNNSQFYNFSGATLNNAGDFQVSVGAELTGDALPAYGYGSFSQTAGSSIIDGSMKQSSIEFQGGTLSGSGSVETTGGPIVIGAGATVNPGNSPGTLTLIGDVLFDGTLIVEIDSVFSFDLLDIQGQASFGAGSLFSFVFDGLFVPELSQDFEFLTAGAIDGFSNLSFSAVGLAPGFDLNVFTDAESDLHLQFVQQVPPSTVPEPGLLALWAVGLPLMAWRSRRRVQHGSATQRPPALY